MSFRTRQQTIRTVLHSQEIQYCVSRIRQAQISVKGNRTVYTARRINAERAACRKERATSVCSRGWLRRKDRCRPVRSCSDTAAPVAGAAHHHLACALVGRLPSRATLSSSCVLPASAAPQVMKDNGLLLLTAALFQVNLSDRRGVHLCTQNQLRRICISMYQ